MAGDGGPVPSLTVTPAERSPLSQGGLSPSSPRTQVAGQPCLLAPCHVHSPASSPGGCPLPDTGPLATHDSCPPRQRRAGSQAFLLNMHSQYPLANRGKDFLEEDMATHSSILARRIPWTEEPGRQQSMGLKESN